MGAIDNPLNPLSVAIGCEATFVARSIDVNIKHLGETLQAGRRAQGHGLRRGLSELQRLQRRRLGLRHRQGHQVRHDHRAGARQAADLRQEQGQGHPPQRHRAGDRRAGQGHQPPTTCCSTTRSRPSRRWPTCSAACGTPSSPSRSACSAPSMRPKYDVELNRQIEAASDEARPRRPQRPVQQRRNVDRRLTWYSASAGCRSGMTRGGKPLMLLPCPYCDNEVIEGADECEACGQPLTESHLPVPATAVERALLTDRVRLFRAASRWWFRPRCRSARCCGSWSITRSAASLVADRARSSAFSPSATCC